MLAHHYLEAIELARSAGIDASELLPKAAAALREAGMRAFAIGAFPAAVRALRAAAEWLPDGLDPCALRVARQGAQSSHRTRVQDELQAAFDRLLRGGSDAEGGGRRDRPALINWRHGDGEAAERAPCERSSSSTGRRPKPEHARFSRRRRGYRMVSGRHEESRRVGRAGNRARRHGRLPGARVSAMITRATAQGEHGRLRRRAGGLRQGAARSHALTTPPRSLEPTSTSAPSCSTSETSPARSARPARGSRTASARGRWRAAGGSSSATSRRRCSSPASGKRPRRSPAQGSSMPAERAATTTSRCSSSSCPSSRSSATAARRGSSRRSSPDRARTPTGRRPGALSRALASGVDAGATGYDAEAGGLVDDLVRPATGQPEGRHGRATGCCSRR